jgi:hypothetical protein
MKALDILCLWRGEEAVGVFGEEEFDFRLERTK